MPHTVQRELFDLRFRNSLQRLALYRINQLLNKVGRC